MKGKTAYNKRYTRLSTGQDAAGERRLRGSQNRSRACAEALERPLCGFVHPHFASPAKPVGFARSGLQNVVYLERYTSGGGSPSIGRSWAYLYDASGKIGVVRADILGFKYVYLGVDEVNRAMTEKPLVGSPPLEGFDIDTSGMQNDHNGQGSNIGSGS